MFALIPQASLTLVALTFLMNSGGLSLLIVFERLHALIHPNLRMGAMRKSTSSQSMWPSSKNGWQKKRPELLRVTMVKVGVLHRAFLWLSVVSGATNEANGQ